MTLLLNSACLSLALLGCSAPAAPAKSWKFEKPVPHTPMHQDTDFIGVKISGTYPALKFEFEDCGPNAEKMSKFSPAIRYVIVAGPSGSCEIESDTASIPRSWELGSEGSGYRLVRCQPLLPGTYNVSVSGGWKGRATFVLGEDGTATVTKDYCKDPEGSEKQDPSKATAP